MADSPHSAPPSHDPTLVAQSQQMWQRFCKASLVGTIFIAALLALLGIFLI